MAADEERNAPLNVARHPERGRPRQRARRRHFHHVSSIAVAGELRRPSSPRTCSTRARSSRTPTTGPSSRPRSSSASSVNGAVARLPARRSSSATRKTGEMDKIDGPYYFFKAIQKVRHALPQWFPLVGARGRPDQHRAGRLRRRRDGPHRPPGRARRPGVPPRRPEEPARRRRHEHVRRAPATRRTMVMRIDKRMTDMLPKGVLVLRDEAPGAQGHPALACWPTSGIPDEVLDYVALKPQLRRARHQARARGLGHRAPAARDLRRQAVGLLGAQPRPRPVQGPLVRGRRQRQDA